MHVSIGVGCASLSEGDGEVKFYVIYVMCALGLFAGTEVDKTESPVFDRVVVSAFWPITIVAVVFANQVKGDRK